LHSYTAQGPGHVGQLNVQATADSANRLTHLKGALVGGPEQKPTLELQFYPRQHNRSGLAGNLSMANSYHPSPAKRKFEGSVDGRQGRPRKGSNTKNAVGLVQPMRAAIGNKIQNKMLMQGAEWDLESGGPSTAQGISSNNISALRLALAPLREYETKFIDHFLATRLFATHATRPGALDDQSGHVSIFSRAKLQERGIEFPETNTEAQDIEGYATDDHVFFSLEAGNEPQKPVSRFGQELLRFDFDHPAIQQTGILNLVDPATGLPPPALDRFPAIENHPDQFEKAHALENLSNAEYSPKESLFHGSHMKTGLGLAIIKNCRDNVPDSIGKKLLSTGTDEDTNKLLNGLFRPTIMVPRHFFGTPVDKASLGSFDFEMEEG